MDRIMSMFCSTNNHSQSDLRVELLDILRDLLSAAEPKEIDRALLMVRAAPSSVA
jgi:predicted neuraminidase